MTNDQPHSRQIKYSESDIPKEFFILTGQEMISVDETPNTESLTHIIIAYQPSKWSILRDDDDLICLVSASDINDTVTVSKVDLMISEKWVSETLHLNKANLFHTCQQILPQLFEQQKNYIVKTFPVWQTKK